MNIQHLYPQDNQLIAKHIDILGQMVGDAVPDIVHVHGCWDYAVVKRALHAHRQGARIVFTPHGGLEPWIVSERRFSEKLYKTLLWQRRLVEYSYVVIAHGTMEAEALKQLGWNPRTEIIRNAVITNSITPEAMAQQTKEVYKKVMDSNTIELMSNDSRRLITMLLKAGITGDKRWVTQQLPVVDSTEWRRILIYADHENIRTILDRGVNVMNVHHDYIETSNIKSYLPTDYKKPKVNAYDVAGIVNEMNRNKITIRHFVELDRALRSPDVDEEWLVDTFDEGHLLKFFRRLLQVLTEVTDIDEGFIPVTPLDDKKTQKIRNNLYNHLTI